jgi:hypothetical protein
MGADLIGTDGVDACMTEVPGAVDVLERCGWLGGRW